ncbi:class I SAM-dependent methyltransferase [Flavobacterium cupreum]|uniref:Class I SAM-dependent methyltransferase n=2 Tax=Flavobacterium TaxID=237 RepID=A0A4Y7U5S8_9FLAO|nr:MULTISPECIES: class I SAM-dependent methyltransferase [Flavobacterium]RUT67748.1 class I SAM-dependent methyltransferase [Flavobacterium cupreum]TCN50534.1 methyltransferase family protein [Flavobacterium circumlabens]TEB41785.1 class I SAM-dependent methyltransferase [Flavobacterium circumlabens]
MENNKSHWENVFASKGPQDVSWTQKYPKTAMQYLENLNLPKTSNIIDVGGGESNFVDVLLEKGFQNIWVLDISEFALEKAKKRLGKKAELVHWIVSDITEFQPEVTFDFWYDRAVFHFLTEQESVMKYITIVGNSINKEGHFLLGTFSENGPTKCSGLEIKQYSESSMKQTFAKSFNAINCFTENHTTPFDTIQNFQFCGFEKI